MRIRRGLYALGPPLAAALAAASVPWLSRHVSDFAGASLWGLVLLWSFVGWGAALLDSLRLDRDFGWGMHAAVGMAAAIAVGGVLQLGFWVSPATATTWLLGGLAAQAVLRWRRRALLAGEVANWWSSVRATPLLSAAVGALYCVAFFRFFGSFATPVANPWDDFEAYFAFPKSLLANGALHEPFSIRRLINLGGQPYLQSLLLTGSNPFRLNGFDSGLCLLSIFGLVDGAARRARAPRVLALAFVVGFVYEVHSVNSALSGSVFFLALFRVLDECADDLSERSVQIALALLGSAAWTLRQNYLVTVVAILGATYALYAGRRPPDRRRAALGLASTLSFVALFLTPWWVVTYRSSGTFLYPAMIGNGRPDFGLTSDISAREELGFFVFNALWNRPVSSIWLFVLAALCVDSARKSRGLRPFLLGTGVGVFAVIHACRAWDDVSSMSRYYMAFEIALVLAVLLKCTVDVNEGTATASLRSRIGAALAVLAVGAQLWSTAAEAQRQYSTWGQQIAIQLPMPTAVDEQDLLYQRLQRAIPAGSTVLEMLDQPFRLDFNRNRVLICDMPGGASPRPGLPIFGSVEQSERYFAAQSIRYIAYTLGPASPEYKRSLWLGRLRKLDPKVRTGHSLSTLFRQMGTVYLGVFDLLDRLEARHAKVFSEGQIRVLDLASPPPP